MSLHRTITITCDFPTEPTCTHKFGPKSDELGDARKEAREAGWYVGTADKAYCPDHVEALGIRVRAST